MSKVSPKEVCDMLHERAPMPKVNDLYSIAAAKIQGRNIEFGKASDHILFYGPRSISNASANSRYEKPGSIS